METILSMCIVIGIPAIFLVLCIKNIMGIVRSKKNKTTVKKSTIIKAIIFGVIFISIILFYMWLEYSLSKAVAYM